MAQKQSRYSCPKYLAAADWVWSAFVAAAAVSVAEPAEKTNGVNPGAGLHCEIGYWLLGFSKYKQTGLRWRAQTWSRVPPWSVHLILLFVRCVAALRCWFLIQFQRRYREILGTRHEGIRSRPALLCTNLCIDWFYGPVATGKIGHSGEKLTKPFLEKD